MKSLIGKIIEVKSSVDFSAAQEKVYSELKGRKFTIKKFVCGEKLLCDCCGKKSRVKNSLFVVVENDRKEVRRIAQGCLKVYFSIELSSGGSSIGRLSKITL